MSSGLQVRPGSVPDPLEKRKACVWEFYSQSFINVSRSKCSAEGFTATLSVGFIMKTDALSFLHKTSFPENFQKYST